MASRGPGAQSPTVTLDVRGYSRVEPQSAPGAHAPNATLIPSAKAA
jgi:hypothetical protein